MAIFDLVMAERSKLQKFTEFTQALLPHETGYLLSIQHFDDKVKLAILQRIDHNCRHRQAFVPYDETVDKRKYSNLKRWIRERLQAIDVDADYERLLQAERAIETDQIRPETEEQLLERLRAATPQDYHFVKCYQVAQLYRHYLLIRMRYAEHRAVAAFLDRYQAAYTRAQAVRERLHQATQDIVCHYANPNAQSIQWEAELAQLFHDETLDGWNRYMALVRLTFIYYNYRHLEPLREKYAALDRLLLQGQYYSRRLLINYYGNRLLLHVQLKEYDEAEYYGYLSIRTKTADYLHYVNNLCAVLLRRKKYDEALSVMKAALPESRITHSFHNKIGFIALYLRCLTRMGRLSAAEQYADACLRAYRREIFEHRWHAFFSAYLEALILQRHYKRTLHLIKRYRLLERDQAYSAKSAYLPTIPLLYAFAARAEGLLNDQDLEHAIRHAQNLCADQPEKAVQITSLLQDLREHLAI